MPRRCVLDPAFSGLLRHQDWVIHRDQSLSSGMTAAAIGRRLASGQWQLLLPSVYLTHPGEPSRRQQTIAANLYAGPRSAIDAADACRFYGLRSVTADNSRVQVVVPWGESARSRGFVVVRRTIAPLEVTDVDPVRFLALPAAAIAAARRMRGDRPVLALLSEAVQRKLTSYDELVRAQIQLPRRGTGAIDRALEHLGAGVRSVPEGDFLCLASASLILPEPIYNPVIQLPNGTLVSPDALWPDAGLVHETNGRAAHARADLFEDMQTRHDTMTAAGLTVLHNSPRRLRLEGPRVVAELERCYVRLRGRGLPDGVTIVRHEAA